MGGFVWVVNKANIEVVASCQCLLTHVFDYEVTA